MVKGKPGSGKSTFSKFIFDHLKTKDLLHLWSGGRPILLVFHSFWRVGTELQQNWKGLLASLLYQIVSDKPGLIDLAGIVNTYGQRRILSDWSPKELHRCLFLVLDALKEGICIFLDGLDEFDQEDNNDDKVLELIEKLQSGSPQCKIFLSSRPDIAILANFSASPSLRLQDLTGADLQRYVDKTLRAKTRTVPNDSRKED